jgi:hypothetical protein
MAGKGAPDSRGMATVIDQGIVVSQFFAGLDIHQRVNIDAAVLVFQRLAVRLAGMIDEARSIAAAGAIDNPPIGQTEEIGVIDRGAGRFGSLQRLLPPDSLALVFDDA